MSCGFLGYRACVLMLGLTPQMIVVLDVMRLVAVGDDVEIGEVAIEVDVVSVRAFVRQATVLLMSSFTYLIIKGLMEKYNRQCSN